MNRQCQQNCSGNVPKASFSVEGQVRLRYSSDVKHSTGSLLTLLLEDSGMRKKELMDKTGISRTKLFGHLKGEVFPDETDRLKYATAFRMTFDEFEDLRRKGDLAMKVTVALQELARRSDVEQDETIRSLPASVTEIAMRIAAKKKR